MANMKDVAQKAGVSIATVSLVLNNRGSISEATRNRVYQVMKELNYQPNEIARSIQSRRSGIFGLLVPTIGHPFFSMLTAAIAESCYQHGYRLMIYTTNGEQDRELNTLSLMRSSQVEGIILSSQWDKLDQLTQMALPLVAIERPLPNLPSIVCDNYLGGKLAAQELAAAGCTRLVLLSNYINPAMPSYGRIQGFEDACNELGLPYRIELLPSKAESPYASVARMHTDVDGYFCTSDIVAAQLAHELAGLGRKAPHDYKLIGYDGVDIARYCDISTIAQPIQEMGEAAVSALVQQIAGQHVDSQIMLPVSLIRRSSTTP